MKEQKTSYRTLDVDKTLSTLRQLSNRIQERFAESSLSSVAAELCEVAADSRSRIAWIERPHKGLRLAIFALIVICFSLAVYAGNQLFKIKSLMIF
jgi:hypothetical protein